EREARQRKLISLWHQSLPSSVRIARAENTLLKLTIEKKKGAEKVALFGFRFCAGFLESGIRNSLRP
ncbi:MAG: hypothetical protein AABZ61_11975, partial [Bacteroidota bacterium]